jgi:flagellar basal-body rod protein FlgC
MANDFFSSMEVSAAGLGVQRTRMNAASSNLANVNTTRGADGNGPYRRRDVVVEAVPMGRQAPGVFAARVDDVVEDQGPPRLEYDPGHPDANAEGYVAYPNVNMVEEMVDMITASRAYEAGVTALNTTVALAERATRIGG